MRRNLSLLCAYVGLAIASPTTFSVQDDVLAVPRYEVIVSESCVSESDAYLTLEHTPIAFGDEETLQDSKVLQSQDGQDGQNTARKTYEKMVLLDQEYLCSIPIVDTPVRNKTSEAKALAEEQKELARATDRGWELLQGLGGGQCLYFNSGWWSYSFCPNSEVTQFHQLPPHPGRPASPPQTDPNYSQYVLGRVKTYMKDKEDKEDEWGDEIEARKDQKSTDLQNTELQIKGETRYLVQRMDGGTTCDLTSKPRRIEIQYHCDPQVNDRISWVKEVTTCSYVMVVYTSRLCDDVAFLPPKEGKANIIACHPIVPDDEVSSWKSHKTVEDEIVLREGEPKPSSTNVGGIILGGGKYFGKGGPKLQLPTNWQGVTQVLIDAPTEFIIAISGGKVANYKVEAMSDEELRKRNIDPEVVEELKIQMQEMAGDKPWRIEVVAVAGGIPQFKMILDDDENGGSDSNDGNEDKGSEETYAEEL